MDSMASPDGAESLLWAEGTSWRLLEPSGRRWRHTLGVVDRARAAAEALAPEDAAVLLAAAYLHDVGYAPTMARTGLHPLDAARFVRDCGHQRLAGLVAHHGSADAEAVERGLLAELMEFVNEGSVVARALTYCDLSTDLDGNRTGAAARIAEIRERYGATSPEARALDRSEVALLDDVRVVEEVLADRSRAGRSLRWR
jgi:HD superfamily phosphodiesterase